VAALAVTNPLFQFKLQYSRDEAAAILGFSLRTVDRLIAENQLHVRRTGRRVLITRVELEQFTKRDHPTGGVQ
jgi:excisionase family DNA binding protein